MRIRVASAGFVVLLAVLLVDCDDPLRPQAGNRQPEAAITTPADGRSFLLGESITFRGSATDPEDGVLPPSGLQWATSTEAALGGGDRFDRDDLAIGSHTVMLIATDSEGLPDTASITIHVEPLPPPIDSRAPLVDSIRISPESVDVSRDSAVVTAQLHVRDDIAGVDSIMVVLSAPDGEAVQVRTSSQSVLGTRLDGAWTVVFTLARWAEPGNWSVSRVILTDLAGNTADLSAPELAARGLGANVLVVVAADEDGPTPASLVIQPDTVDVDSGGAFVTIDASARDSLSGVQSVRLTLASSSGLRSVSATALDHQSGSRWDGSWRVVLGIPRFAEAGMWSVSALELRDAAGNATVLDAAQLASAGFQHEVYVQSTFPDTAPPDLDGLALEPDSTIAGSNVTAELALRDAISGVDSVVLVLRGDGADSAGNVLRAPSSGTRTDGTWQGTLTVPASALGEWTLSARLIDGAGNVLELDAPGLQAAGFDSRVRVLPADTGYFTLTGFELEPDTIDVSADSAEFTMRLTGRSAIGVSLVYVLFRPRNGAQPLSDVLYLPVSGTRHDGAWQHTFTIPRYATPGEWRVDQLWVMDDYGYNSAVYDSTTLAGLGFDSRVHVIDANPDSVAPDLLSLSISPDSVSVATDSAVVTAVLNVTDDVSGVASVYVGAFSPSTYEGRSVTLAFPVSGTRQDGVWTANLTLPRFSESGLWRLLVGVTDRAGNERWLEAHELELAGFESGFVVQ